MNENIEKIVRRSFVKLKNETPTILTGLGVAGLIFTTIAAVQATPKALRVLDYAKEEKGEDLTPLEVVKEVAHVYIPTLLIGATTISCVVGANITNQRKQASLIGACCFGSKALTEYREKVKELLGEETDIQIREAIAKDKRNEDIIGYVPGYNSAVDSDNKRLFYDEYRGAYFEASMDEVRNAEYHLNRNFTLGGCVTLNDFYEFLGLEPLHFGDALGWSWYKVSEEWGSSWIDFDHRLVKMEDGMECYILEMVIPPTADYDEDY